eukprot:4005440-Karenia_brevis.AAC.1
MVTDRGITLGLCSLDRRSFLHEVRESLRRWQLRTASAKRNDMKGSERDVDRHATLSLLSKRQTSVYDKGVLR